LSVEISPSLNWKNYRNESTDFFFWLGFQ
jgi:hypothetical protein